jgi:hypothetical protein
MLHKWRRYVFGQNSRESLQTVTQFVARHNVLPKRCLLLKFSPFLHGASVARSPQFVIAYVPFYPFYNCDIVIMVALLFL